MLVYAKGDMMPLDASHNGSPLEQAAAPGIRPEDASDTRFTCGADVQVMSASNAEGDAAANAAAGSADAADAAEAPSSRTPEELAEIAERNAFIRALDAALTDIRQRSYEGKLTTSARWVKRSFAPEGMGAKEFEEQALSYIEDCEHADAKPVTGRITAPQPLEVELGEAYAQDDDLLPDPDVHDIALMYGKKGTYLYSVALLSHSFARALYLTSEDNDVATFVDVVRTESSVYPRPACIDSFSNPPYLWSHEKTMRVFEDTVAGGSFKDIHITYTSTKVPYFYSDIYLSEAQAASLAQWYGVERGLNP